jgi:MFS family permease
MPQMIAGRFIMIADVNLKEIQRKVYMSFFEDGVWDIFLGLFILGWGLSILTEAAYLPAISFVGIYSSIWGIKKWLTYPRIGYVKFSSTSRRRITTRFLVLGIAVLLLGVVVALLWGIGERPQWLVDYFPILFSGMFAAVVCFAAYWFRINRFYMHAGLIFLGAVLHQWLDVQWEFGFIGAGSIIVLVGLGFLIGFIRKYPRPIQEAPGGYR